MEKRAKSFLDGMGSILELCPASDYRSFVPTQSSEERMMLHWQRVGSSLRRAMDRVANEQKKSR